MSGAPDPREPRDSRASGGPGGSAAPRRQPALLSLLLTLVGIAVGVTLVFLGSRMDAVELFGLEVSPALPMLLTYIAGMLVGRFGNAPRR